MQQAESFSFQDFLQDDSSLGCPPLADTGIDTQREGLYWRDEIYNWVQAIGPPDEIEAIGRQRV